MYALIQMEPWPYTWIYIQQKHTEPNHKGSIVNRLWYEHGGSIVNKLW